jgi:TMEM175 potassium channel family protein
MTRALRRESPAHPEDPGLDLERVVFFSDAVFAIAITLLVLELRIPDLPEHAGTDEIVTAIGITMPRIFAWVLSFATIGLYWLAHWRRFRFIDRIDERMAAINLLLLGLIAFVPFPTALIGEHGDQAVVVILYAVSLSAAGVVGPLSWLYAWRAGLVRSDVPAETVRLGALRGFSVPVVMLGSLVLLPLVGPSGVELLWLLIIPVQFGMNRAIARRERTSSDAAD